MRRIAVIGAGASGLPAIKACLEEGADVVCFERTQEIGGLWNWRDHLDKDQGTVMRSTIINTSKEMMAYSDFPPPAHVPNFMHNSVLNDYLHSYADHFDLARHVRFGVEVVQVRKASNFDETGEVLIRSRPYKPVPADDSLKSDIEIVEADEEVVEERFSGVLVCTGHHGTPYMPSIKGMDVFPGGVMHSQEFRDARTLSGKSVLVVGIGNSAIDAAIELSRDVSNKVFLSTRRGTWVWNRVSRQGFPHDIWFMTRLWEVWKYIFGYRIGSRYLEHMLNQRFDHDMYNIRPTHGFFNAHPAVNDLLPNCLCSGQITIKGDVDRATPDGRVEFVDGTSEAVDDVILSTGYKFHIPFLDEDLFPSEENRISLYKYVFNPELRHPSMAFIGYIQPIGAVQPISELQARWAVRVMLGKESLPSPSEMRADVAAKAETMRRRYYESPKHTVQVDYVTYMDEIARLIGACPFRHSLLLTDPKLWGSLLWGPSVPYSFRIYGPNAWSGAREATMTVLERVRAPFRPAPTKEPKAKARPWRREVRVGWANLWTPVFAAKLSLLGLFCLAGVASFVGAGWTIPVTVSYSLRLHS